MNTNQERLLNNEMNARSHARSVEDGKLLFFFVVSAYYISSIFDKLKKIIHKLLFPLSHVWRSNLLNLEAGPVQRSSEIELKSRPEGTCLPVKGFSVSSRL